MKIEPASNRNVMLNGRSLAFLGYFLDKLGKQKV
jgi:hypothetical protein